MSAAKPNPLRKIPSVETLMRDFEAQNAMPDISRKVLVELVRDAVKDFRADLSKGGEFPSQEDAVRKEILRRVLPRAQGTMRPHYGRAINATGIILHTGLGRAVLPTTALDQIREELAGRLLTLYQQNRSEQWRWYEKGLTYCNAALPQSMLMCGHWIPNNSMTQAGIESLDWLANLQRSGADGGHFAPIGSNGFYQYGAERARFDQQPVEAQAMVSACLEAYRITGDQRWRKEARRAFEWFLGRNDLNLPLYDPTTGGCRDGLHPDRPNENQGAESTLAFLQSLLELRLAENALVSLEAHHKEQEASRIFFDGIKII